MSVNKPVKMQENIETAERVVKEDSERHPIKNDSYGDIEGYVKPGEKPVGCTDQLKSYLEEIVARDGSITGELPTPQGSDEAHTRHDLSPGDTRYIELLNELLTRYTIIRE